MLRALSRNASRSRDEGASAVEYGLLVAAIAALIIAAVFLLGGLIKNTFANTCSAINTAGTTQTSSSNC